MATDKFREFYKLLDDAKAGNIDVVLIAWPEVLGDDYEELIENLSRLAEANLTLAIASRKPVPQQPGAAE